MSVNVLVTLAPYAIEAAKLVADYIELAQKDNPTETDIEVLEMRFRASQSRAAEALGNLRDAIEKGKREGRHPNVKPGSVIWPDPDGDGRLALEPMDPRQPSTE